MRIEDSVVNAEVSIRFKFDQNANLRGGYAYDEHPIREVFEISKVPKKGGKPRNKVISGTAKHRRGLVMNKNIKSVMTKKELEIIECGTRANVKLHSNASLKKYIQLTRTLRDKYRSMVDLHRGSNRHRPNRNDIEKVHIFGVVLGRYDRQYRKNLMEAECMT